jgi:hypothetical protein
MGVGASVTCDADANPLRTRATTSHSATGSRPRSLWKLLTAEKLGCKLGAFIVPRLPNQIINLAIVAGLLARGENCWSLKNLNYKWMVQPYVAEV